ncbi:hypothetical protein OIDMADRAFT_22710 [Oidiodendron maius Zn]|uniref:Uncharacterized protein n=1 Tax=Oidiodendron maius (strain Zn) TaxID=913774 RepID=A0A0C3D946_OIDMZ|nr:hypothetical protein OIDMADRAFT_22710 [Oidiodendron maius Zn]
MWESAVPASPGRQWAADQSEGEKSHVRQSFAWRPGQLQRQHSTSPSVRSESRRDFAALVPTGATHSADGHRVVGGLSPLGRKHEFGMNLKLLPSKNGTSKYNRNQIYGASLLRSPIGHDHHLDLRVELHDSPFGYASSDSSGALSGEMSGDACVVVENIQRGSGSRQVMLSIPSPSSPRTQRTYHNHTSLAQARRGAMHIIITFPSDP